MAYSIKVREHNGRCVIRLRCPITGKDISKTFNNYNDPRQRHEAEGVAIALTEARLNGTWTGDIDDYLPDDVRVRNRPLIEALEAKIGDRKTCVDKTLVSKLSKLPALKSPADVKRFLEGLNVKAATVNRYKAAIGAVRPDLVEGVKKRREAKSLPQPWEEHERKAICGWFEGTKYEHYVWMLFKTGMRPGELKALTPDDFIKNKKGWFISVTKNLNENGLQDKPKNGKDRLVPLGEVDWLVCFNAVIVNYEFYRTIDLSNFRVRQWRKCLKELGYKYRKPYTMRHTAISDYLCGGGNYATAAQWFGTSGVIIEKHYAGLLGSNGTL